MLCVNIYWHSKKKTKFFLKLELTLSIIHSVEDKEVDDRSPEKDPSSSITQASRTMPSQSQGGQK